MVTDPYVPKFFVRGVAYQVEIGVDPIADDYLPSLERDVLLFKELGLNTVYVCQYEHHDLMISACALTIPTVKIDNTKSHDKAMKLLEEAGIYVLTVSVVVTGCQSYWTLLNNCVSGCVKFGFCHQPPRPPSILHGRCALKLLCDCGCYGSLSQHTGHTCGEHVD